MFSLKPWETRLGVILLYFLFTFVMLHDFNFLNLLMFDCKFTVSFSCKYTQDNTIVFTLSLKYNSQSELKILSYCYMVFFSMYRPMIVKCFTLMFYANSKRHNVSVHCMEHGFIHVQVYQLLATVNSKTKYISQNL